MTSDEPATDVGQDTTAQHIESAVEASAAATGDSVSATADAASSVGQELSEVAQQASQEGAQAYAAASSETAQAFEQARGRLQALGMPGLDVGQGMFDQLRHNTDRMSQQIFERYGQNAQVLAEFNAKAVEAWRTNAEAALAHWQSLAGVTSWSDLVALNSAHARKQIEAMTAQTRELTEIAGRVARQGKGRESTGG